MRGNWRTISSSGRYSLLADEADLPVPLVVQPMRTARRLRLRFDPARGVLKLTCPTRTSRRAALAWVADQRDWIDNQLAAGLPANPLVPGAVFPLLGRDVTIAWQKTDARTPILVGDELRCGGPREGLARRIETHLRRQASDTLSRETAEIAARAGLRATSVSVGDADSRWGSCSSSGRIRYSWRLILAPPLARRFVVAHEVAHLKHLNHGPRFKALETELFGDGVAEARALLRAVGPRLKRVGRGL